MHSINEDNCVNIENSLTVYISNIDLTLILGVTNKNITTKSRQGV